jgi:hypothetical protein
MTPTINEIQTQILTTAAGADALPATAVLTENEQATLNNLTSTSKVSVWRLIVFVVATVAWSIYKLFDIHKQDVDDRIARAMPFQQLQIIAYALNYQHGQALTEWNEYDNTGLTIAEVAAKKIVAKCSVEEASRNGHGILRLKTAKNVGGDLAKLTAGELAGFKAYMKQKGAAGITIDASSEDADRLRVNYKLYFNPSVLNNLGQRLDGSDETPVNNAIKAYLKDKNLIDFNGKLSITELTDIIQAVPGIVPNGVFFQSAASYYGTYDYDQTNPQGNVGPFTEYRLPQSGYFKLDEINSAFTYLPRA